MIATVSQAAKIFGRMAEDLAASYGTPSSFPIRQSFSIAGTFRVYFNRHQAAPLVWCVAVMDTGDVIAVPMLEIACAELAIDAPVTTVYAPKATPDDEDGKPSAWLEVTGVLSVDGRSVRITRAA